jgi:hypothetical protein
MARLGVLPEQTAELSGVSVEQARRLQTEPVVKVFPGKMAIGVTEIENLVLPAEMHERLEKIRKARRKRRGETQPPLEG